MLSLAIIEAYKTTTLTKETTMFNSPTSSCCDAPAVSINHEDATGNCTECKDHCEVYEGEAAPQDKGNWGGYDVAWRG